jgi:hypothetical protein
MLSTSSPRTRLWAPCELARSILLLVPHLRRRRRPGVLRLGLLHVIDSSIQVLLERHGGSGMRDDPEERALGGRQRARTVMSLEHRRVVGVGVVIPVISSYHQSSDVLAAALTM